MILPIVKYGNPILRKKGEKIITPDSQIRKLAAAMLETMAAAKGLGLAAQQVGQAVQLAVIDLRDATDRPSALWIEDKQIDPNELMPLIFIDPIITPASPIVKSTEGCLSFPDIFLEIERPGEINFKAIDLEGRPINFKCSGLLARAIQHETDHLNGILFIDRAKKTELDEVQTQLESLRQETISELSSKNPKR